MVGVYIANPSRMVKKKKLSKIDIDVGVSCFKCKKIIGEGNLIWGLPKYTHYDCNYPNGK